MCIHFFHLHETIKYLSCFSSRHYVKTILKCKWQHLFYTAKIMTTKILSNLPHKCLQQAEAEVMNVLSHQRPLFVGGLSCIVRQNTVFKIWWPK